MPWLLSGSNWSWPGFAPGRGPSSWPGCFELRGWDGQGEVDPEAAAVAIGAIDAGRSAHSFHSTFDDRQTYAGARVLFRTLEALEEAEDSFPMLRGNADAVVFNPNTDKFVIGLGAHFYLWSTPFRDELEGVAE